MKTYSSLRKSQARSCGLPRFFSRMEIYIRDSHGLAEVLSLGSFTAQGRHPPMPAVHGALLKGALETQKVGHCAAHLFPLPGVIASSSSSPPDGQGSFQLVVSFAAPRLGALQWSQSHNR